MFVPHAVMMRNLGFEPDNEAGFMKNRWVEIGHKKADLIRKEKAFRLAAMNRHADKIIAILSKFAKIASTNYRYNKMMAKFRQHRIAPKPRFAVGEPTWADIMDEEDRQRKAAQSAYEARLVAMPERELNEYNMRAIEEIRSHGDDVTSWVEFMRGIRAKRIVAQVNIVEGEQIWKEMAQNTLNLHDKQTVAPVRRLRGPPSARAPKLRGPPSAQNAFSMLADSDDE
jgi:hypothetical protein